MNKLVKTLALLCPLATLPVFADELVLNYDGFFDRIDDLNEPEYQGIKLAFYLVNQQGEACDIDSVKVKTKLKSTDVYFYPNGEILLPYDEDLDRNKASIVITSKSDVAQCGLNMRIESSMLMQQSYKAQDLISLADKFDAGLDDLGGMMSFLMPDVSGVTVELDGEKNLREINGLGNCQNNKCVISSSELANWSGEVQFSQVPTRISPFIGK